MSHIDIQTDTREHVASSTEQEREGLEQATELISPGGVRRIGIVGAHPDDQLSLAGSLGYLC